MSDSEVKLMDVDIMESATDDKSDSTMMNQQQESSNQRDDEEMKDSSHESTSNSSCDDDDEDEDDESEAESSEFDEDINVQTRDEYMKQMQNIEQIFTDVSKRLYSERRKLIDKKLQEVKNETSPDYVNEVKLIIEEHNAKLRVVELRGSYYRESWRKMLEAEKLACAQQLQNDKQQLVEQFQNDLDEKFRRLQEDRDNIDNSVYDANSGSSVFDSKGRKISTSKQGSLKSGGPGNKRKKKTVAVTGPYIVYMLRDEEIESDLAEMRKAVNMSQRLRSKNLRRRIITRTCRYDDGKLVYSGRTFQKGQPVAIRKNQTDPFVYGTIVGVNQKEVLIRQKNGRNSKIYLHQLQRGRIFLHAQD